MGTKRICCVEFRIPHFAIDELVEVEVNERDPFKIERIKGSDGFRFFDKDIMGTATDTKEVKSNYSGWIYFGTRYKREEVIKTLKKNRGNHRLLFRLEEMMNSDDVCYDPLSGIYYELKPGDMTMEELIKEREKDAEKEEATQMMFNELRKNEEQSLLLRAYSYGVKIETYVMLEEVEDFSHIKCYEFRSKTQMIIPFISSGITIEQIKTEDGEVLYNNPYLKNNRNYVDLSTEEINKMIIQIFGTRIAINSFKDWDKRPNDTLTLLHQDFKSDKIKYMVLGLLHMEKENYENWLKHAPIAIKDSASILPVVIAMCYLKKTDNFELIEKIYNDFGLDKCSQAITTDEIAFFLNNDWGQEFKKHWDEKHGPIARENDFERTMNKYASNLPEAQKTYRKVLCDLRRNYKRATEETD
jgi:hypothetical protein